MSGEVFVGVSIQGGLIPADLPSQLASGRDPQGNALSPKDYHLAAGETVRDAANRVWAYLLGAWTGYRDALAQLPADAPTTALTRERFLLILLDQLGYGRVPPTGKGGLRVDGRSFTVSHQWGATPFTSSGRVPPLILERKASPERPVRHRNRWCRSCSTGVTITCGASSPMARS